MDSESSSLPSLSALHDLRGRVAFVTGWANGIGRACSRRLVEAGAQVCGFDIVTGTDEAIAEVGGKPEQLLAVQGDVRSRQDIDEGVASALSSFGRLDVVVNSAGLFPPAAALDVDQELWDHVLDVNAGGTFLVSQVCARQMRELGTAGTIVNIASKSSLQPTLGFAHYAASKGAVAMITKALALELAPLSIRVNAVAPGGVATETASRMGQLLTPELIAASGGRANRTPMGRSATPDEIARVVLFLASDWSAYMTGSVVLADGGFLVS